MFDTYKSMKSVPTRELSNLTIEEAVVKFQTTTNLSEQNKCYAYVFCSLFPMLMKIHHKYATLTIAERTEECLIRLLHSMRKYSASKNVKFTTYIYGNLNRSLISLCHQATHNCRRKVWQNLADLDPTVKAHVINSTKDTETRQAYSEFISNLNNSSILSSQEIDFCKSVLFGFKYNKDIVTAMNLTSCGKYDKRTRKYTHVQLTHADALKHLSAMKRNIKKKVKENNLSFI